MTSKEAKLVFLGMEIEHYERLKAKHLDNRFLIKIYDNIIKTKQKEYLSIKQEINDLSKITGIGEKENCDQ